MVLLLFGSDGAAAVVLASAAAVAAHGLKVLAVIRGFGEAEQVRSGVHHGYTTGTVTKASLRTSSQEAVDVRVFLSSVYVDTLALMLAYIRQNVC